MDPSSDKSATASPHRPGAVGESSRVVAFLVLVLALIVVIYAPVRQALFLDWDDTTYVVDNDHVKGGLSWASITWAFTRAYAANWHPLTWISHMVDCQLFGLQPGWHHLGNVVFHSLNTLLVFLLLRRLTGATWRSAIVAALFALHPLRVESVAWISERKDVQSAFFGLLSLLAYVRAVESGPAGRVPRVGWLWFSWAMLALGLLSKAMPVTWPFLFLVLDAWPLQRWPGRLGGAGAGGRASATSVGRLVAEKWPFFALVALVCGLTVWAQAAGGAVASLQSLPVFNRVQNAIVAYVLYLENAFWPAALYPFYEHPERWPWTTSLAAAVALVAVTVYAWKGRARQPYLWTGWCWYVGTLVPVIGLVQVGSQSFADRYSYVPQIGLAWMVVWGVADLVRARGLPRWVPAALTAVVLLAGTLLSVRQVRYWHDTKTLFARALQLAPNNYWALYILGGIQLQEGHVEQARPLLERALQINPRFAGPHLRLAAHYANQGDTAAAMRNYEAAVQIGESSPELFNNMAWIRAASPDPAFRNGAEAVRLATRACEATRYEKPIYIGTLAAAYAQQGNFQKAIELAQRARNLAASLSLPEIVRANEALLQLYQAGKAAHGAAP